MARRPVRSLPPFRVFRLWVGCHAVQLWMAFSFVIMGIIAAAPDEPRFAPIWPVVFALIGIGAAGTVYRPDARHLVAAVGAALAVVSVSRALALSELFWPLQSDPLQALHVVLWGLYAVVGLRWPQVVHDASLRFAVEKGRGLAAVPPPTPPITTED